MTHDLHTLGKAMRDAQRAYNAERSHENGKRMMAAVDAFDKALSEPPAALAGVRAASLKLDRSAYRSAEELQAAVEQFEAAARESLGFADEPPAAPGMTDLMVTPESIDAFIEANPLPSESPAALAAAPYDPTTQPFDEPFRHVDEPPAALAEICDRADAMGIGLAKFPVADVRAAAAALTAQAGEIERLRRERDNLQAALTARAKTMLRARDALINARDSLEDEGDRVYFGTTNDADDFREIVDELADWAWNDIVEDGKLPDVYEASRKAHARAEAAEARIAELREALKPFAEWIDLLDVEFADHDDGTIAGGLPHAFVTFGDLRRARATLAKGGEP